MTGQDARDSRAAFALRDALRAAGAADAELWWDTDAKTPRFIRGHVPLGPRAAGKTSAAAVSSVTDMFDSFKAGMGLDNAGDELRVISQETDAFGMTHVRFQQVYQGLDVWARNLTAHFSSEGALQSLGGRWIRTPSTIQPSTASVSAEEAQTAVQTRFSAKQPPDSQYTRLVVYADRLAHPWLAWKVRAILSDHEAYDVFIDATNGEYIHQVSLVYEDGPAVGTGTDLDSQSRTINCYLIGSNYYMINTTKPMFNLAQSSFPDDPKGAIEIWDKRGLTDNYWYYVKTTNVNNWTVPATVSASYYISKVYDYYMAMHNRNSIDGVGGTINAVVNHPLPEANGNNAYWNSAAQAMTFGTGDGAEFRNLAAALDVTGHEMTHGVIDAEAGLVYEFQSGAMNESFADIFGALTEFHVNGAAGDWLMGEDVVTPGTLGDALRDMEDPSSAFVCATCTQQPTRMSEYWNLTIEQDHGGVHVNSGIPNRAFYLAATAVGRNKADSIFYRALTQYLASYSEFIDLRVAVLQAAEDLYPGNSTIQSGLASAFDTVEIFDGTGGEPPDDLPDPTSGQWIVCKDEWSGRAYRLDTAGAFIGFVSNALVMSKPSAPDSSDWVYFVDETNNMTMVNRAGTIETQLGVEGTDYNSVAISPDDNLLAFFIQGDPTLYVWNFTTAEYQYQWDLYTPTNTEDSKIYDVLWPDVLEWSLDGSKVVFDCLCFSPREVDTLYYWDIRTIDVATGIITRTMPSVTPGLQIGNPTFGRVHPDLLAFDYWRDDDTVQVMAANLSENGFAVISINGTSLGRPTFSPTDDKVLFEFDDGSGPDLWRIGFDAEPGGTVGDFEYIEEAASFPNWRFEGREILSGVFDEDEGGVVPAHFRLSQNFPNPFNASTVIEYETTSWGTSTLEIFNVLGQRVVKFDQAGVPPGRHSFHWDGRDEAGVALASGVYLYRVTADGNSQSRKMVMLR